MKKSSTLLASTLAIFALVGFPAAAHAVASGLTTVAVTVNDLPPTSMAQDDIVDVVTHGPIAQFGSA
jgi:hypothetical protein